MIMQQSGIVLLADVVGDLTFEYVASCVALFIKDQGTVAVLLYTPYVKMFAFKFKNLKSRRTAVHPVPSSRPYARWTAV